MICPADIEQLPGNGDRNYCQFIHPAVEKRNLSLFKAWRRYRCKILFILDYIRLRKNLAYIQAIFKFAVYTMSKTDRLQPDCMTAARQQNPEEELSSVIYRYFKVAHRDMVFLKFVLEGYEGMNVMSTVDNKAGIIRIAIMPGFVDDMDELLADLGKQVVMEPTGWRDELYSF